MSDRNKFLYLTTRGWKTGRRHQIEIWFVSVDGRYYLISEKYRRSHWVQNLLRDPNVDFRIGNRSFHGKARIVDSEKEIEIFRRVTALFDIKYGWNEGLLVELTSAAPQP